MSEKKYLILRENIIGWNGFPYSTYFTIQEFKKFLWIGYWRYLRKRSKWYKSPKFKFSSKIEAEEFVRFVLGKNKPIKEKEITEVGKITLNSRGYIL
jgi:hypothetical protein